MGPIPGTSTIAPVTTGTYEYEIATGRLTLGLFSGTVALFPLRATLKAPNGEIGIRGGETWGRLIVEATFDGVFVARVAAGARFLHPLHKATLTTATGARQIRANLAGVGGFWPLSTRLSADGLRLTERSDLSGTNGTYSCGPDELPAITALIAAGLVRNVQRT